MSSLNEYISRYADVSFTEKPFCDADNIALCKISYMPFEKVVSESFDDEPVSFDKVAKDMFAYHGNAHRAVGLLLPKDISRAMMQMAETKRFSELKVVGCKEVFADKPATQFAGATYLSPDGKIYVTFRGTDDTFTGWKEDIDIYTLKGIPSHKLGVDYLNEVGEKFDGEIIVCGHSKGGNIALYSALHCNQSVRDRIIKVYNDEGPGLCDFNFIESEKYKEIYPRYTHFIPNSSFVGMFLAHDEDYTVVKSNKILGPMQHDLSSWQIADDKLEPASLSWLGRFNDYALMKLLTISDDTCVYADVVFSEVINGFGQKDLTGFSKHVIPSIYGGYKAWKSLDKITRDKFHDAFAGTLALLREAAKVTRREAVPAVKRKIEMLATLA